MIDDVTNTSLEELVTILNPDAVSKCIDASDEYVAIVPVTPVAIPAENDPPAPGRPCGPVAPTPVGP
jgi:hypothetical protein